MTQTVAGHADAGIRHAVFFEDVVIAVLPLLFRHSVRDHQFIRGMPPRIHDGVHLHMLVYKRLIRWAVEARNARELTLRNSLTSLYLWLLCLVAVPATLFWRRTLHLFCFVILFALTYVWLYVSIIRFKSPRWLVFRKKRHS
jgi:hypothetical protein